MNTQKKKIIVFAVLLVIMLLFMMLNKPRDGHNSVDPGPVQTAEITESPAAVPSAAPASTPAPTPEPTPTPAPTPTPVPTPPPELLSSGSDIVLIEQTPELNEATGSDIKVIE